MSSRLLSVPRRAALLVALGASVLAPATASAGPVTPVPSVDIQRYLGQWREIASIPQWFNVLCARDTTATYALNSDGTVNVVNRCASPINTTITARGRARVLDTQTNAQLQVTFVNAFGQWFYPGPAEPNYVIIGLSPDYRWAVVGDPQRTSAFILSRAAALTPAERSTVLGILSANGFDACQLQVTRQTGGLQTRQPYCQ